MDANAAYAAALGVQNGGAQAMNNIKNSKDDANLREPEAPQQNKKIKCEFDLFHFQNKVLPKLIYFIVQLSFLIPIIIYSKNYLFYQQEGIIMCILLFVSTALTYASYLKVALADPGVINSMMFNEAYANNNETEVS